MCEVCALCARVRADCPCVSAQISFFISVFFVTTVLCTLFFTLLRVASELHVCVCVCVRVLAVRAHSLLARACVYMYVSACCVHVICVPVCVLLREQNFFLMLFGSYFVARCECVCVCVCVCLCAHCTLALSVGVHPITQPLPVLPLPVILVYRGCV